MDPLFVRPPVPGIGEAVATSRILREKEGEWEGWADVAHRVSFGNVSILGDPLDDPSLNCEYMNLRRHIAAGSVLLSGRHLQHGDETQPGRPQEVMTNCSTAAASHLKLYLLLNGSGVGRDYSDDLMVVNWDRMPHLILTLDADHPDATGEFPTSKQAREASNPDTVFFSVPDSREGWAEAVELVERMAYASTHEDDIVILDFSQVRPEGSPIGGMQGRPASGPVPLMRAIQKMSEIKGRGWAPWKQAMYVDHYLAACVAVGGVRRAARIAIKWWGDEDILEFIDIKQKGGLWSANNSISVDEEFWRRVRNVAFGGSEDPEDLRAYEVFQAATRAQYYHGTGEPGFLNVDRINANLEGFEETYKGGSFVGSARYQVHPETERGLLATLEEAAKQRAYPFIVNPCGEIPLLALNGFCVIGDVVPYHCESLHEAVDAMKSTGRALVRTNLMDSLYSKEVARTNRIGIGLTGIFEFAWKFFGLSFRDLIEDYDRLSYAASLLDSGDIVGGFLELGFVRSGRFWGWLWKARREVEWDVDDYCRSLGLAFPHTMFTIKPAGTTSKLYGLTEGAHLPAKAEYLRFIQLTGNEKSKAEEYEDLGYPVFRNVTNAQGEHVADAIVGFPTRPALFQAGIPRYKVTLADEATMEEQYHWVSLLEQFWLGGGRGAQVSYTLKYDKGEVSFEDYQNTVLEWQPRVRCISVMPSSDWRESKRLYGYVPEEPITAEEYDELMEQIQTAQEMISEEHLICEGGACPI